MPRLMSRVAAIAVLVALGFSSAPVPAAWAEVPAHNRANFDKAWTRIVDVFGGEAQFQAAYEEARAEQARVEGALQISLNLEARFRANNSPGNADIYLNAANGLRISVENMRATFAKFDALDTPVDEARGKAAYDRVTAEHAALFERPMSEQFDYSKTHPLTQEPLVSVQTAAAALVAVAERKPG